MSTSFSVGPVSSNVPHETPPPLLNLDTLPEVLKELNPRMCSFAKYLALYSGNVMKSARLAGYAIGDGNVTGVSSTYYALAQSPRIIAAVEYYREILSFDTLHFTPEKLTRLYETWASINLADVCNDDWELKPKSEWTLEQQQALIGIEVTWKGGKRYVKPKFAKLEAAQMLARFQRMLDHEKDTNVQGFSLNISFGAFPNEKPAIDVEARDIGHLRIEGDEEG